MIRLRRILSNTIISLFGQAISYTSTLLLTMAYGHFLGAFSFGQLYFAITFVSLVGVFVDYGYSNQAIRDVAPRPDQAPRYLSSLFLIKLSTWLIMYPLMLIVSWLLGYNTEVGLLVGICGLDLLFTALANTFASLFYAFERTIFPVVGTILGKGLSALVSILLLRSGAGVEMMALVLVAGSFINAVWQASWFFGLIRTSFIIDLALIREILRTHIPFLIVGVLIIGYTNIDTVLLSLLTNSTVIGWYGAASRIGDAMYFLPTIVITNIMYPVFSKLSITSDADLKLAVGKCMNFLLFCSIPITTVLIVAAPNIITFLYGRSGFSQAIPALQALAPFVVFQYTNCLLVSVLMSKKQERILPVTSGVALVFNITLNLILIPHYQHISPATVTSLTEMLISCILIVVVVRQHLLPLVSLRVAFKVLIASLVMALAILLLHALSILVILPIAMLVYFGATVFLGAIPREDYRAVYRTIRQKAQLTSSTSTDDLSVTPFANNQAQHDLCMVKVQQMIEGRKDRGGC